MTTAGESVATRRDREAAELLDGAVSLLRARGWDGRGGPRGGAVRPLSALAAVYVAYQTAQRETPPGPSAAGYVHCYNALRASVSARTRGLDVQTWERRAVGMDDVVTLLASTARALRQDGEKHAPSV